MQKAELVKLKLKIAFYFPLSFIILAVVLFIPAGTIYYWQGWLFLIILITLALFVTFYFINKAPEFLERRIKFKEKEHTQKLIIAIADLVFFVGFITAGLDYRFGWSQVPAWIVIAADIIIVAGYYLIFLAFRENPYAARTVETFPGHKLVDTGVYSIVRHPMYAGIIPMFIAMPLALGSFWAILFIIPVCAIVILRTINEEEVLKRELKGYADYCKRVPWRLIPQVW